MKNGFSQHQLAESAGVSLRTVQRMENAEAIPRMDTVKRLFQIFGLSPDEVFDWTKTEDKQYLIWMNLSGLAFLLIPLLGVILPIVMWMSRKDKITGVNEQGRALVNFQLTWALVYYLWATFSDWIIGYFNFSGNGDVSPDIVYNYLHVRVFVIFFIYLFEIIMISLNNYRIKKGLKVKYLPKINFLR